MDVSAIAGIIIVLVSILFSMTLHEAMHAFTSHWLGDDTAYKMGRLTLNPLAHIDLFTTILLPIVLILLGLPPFGAAKPVPFNPARVKGDEYGAMLVGIAGPLTNLVLAIISGVWVRFVIGFDAGLLSDTFVIFTFVNLSFFVFNMIPWPPLDGSRVVYALAPEPLQRVMKQIEMTGFMGIFFFMFLIFPFLQIPMIRALEAISSWILGPGVI